MKKEINLTTDEVLKLLNGDRLELEEVVLKIKNE